MGICAISTWLDVELTCSACSAAIGDIEKYGGTCYNYCLQFGHRGCVATHVSNSGTCVIDSTHSCDYVASNPICECQAAESNQD